MGYAISTECPELIPFLLFILFGFPNTINSILLILIDLCAVVWPTFALGYEKAESDLMTRPPRSIHDKMFSGNLAYNSYIRVGLFMTASEITMFILCIVLEFKKYTGGSFSLSNFVSTSYADFQTITL